MVRKSTPGLKNPFVQINETLSILKLEVWSSMPVLSSGIFRGGGNSPGPRYPVRWPLVTCGHWALCQVAAATEELLIHFYLISLNVASHVYLPDTLCNYVVLL